MSEAEFVLGDLVEVRPRRPVSPRHQIDGGLSSSRSFIGRVVRVRIGGRTVAARRYVYTMLVVEDDSGRQVMCYGDEARHVAEEEQHGLVTRLVMRCFKWLERVLDTSGRR